MNNALYSLFLFMSFGLFAQNPVSSTVDSTAIHIGSAFTYTIIAQGDNTSKITFPESQLIGDFEVLESSPVDTLIQDKNTAYSKKYLLTQFDSGSYNISRQSVYINGKNYQTDLHKIDVLPVVVDTLKQPMYDIKPVIGGTVDTSNLIYYILSIVLVLIIGGLIYWWINRKQKKNLTEEDLYKTPLEKVLKELHLLDEKRLIANGSIKAYYSELTDIVRDYTEEIFEIPAKESTSSELIQHLFRVTQDKKVNISRSMINRLNSVLKNADLVKFAKMEPAISEIDADRRVAEEFSTTVDKAVEHLDEERSERVKLREQRFKKRKQIRTWVPIGVTSFLLLVVGGVYAYNTLSDSNMWAIFESNKKLYEQEWLTDSYGMPAVNVQTPKALQRVAVAKKQEAKPSPEAEFVYLNEHTDLYLNIKTTQLSSTEEVSLQGLIDQKIRKFETDFSATNIQHDSQKLTLQGVEGMHVKGSFNGLLSDDMSVADYQFEWYVFIQPSGTQELAVVFEKDDAFGQKIADKFLESLQFNPDQK